MVPLLPLAACRSIFGQENKYINNAPMAVPSVGEWMCEWFSHCTGSPL